MGVTDSGHSIFHRCGQRRLSGFIHELALPASCSRSASLETRPWFGRLTLKAAVWLTQTIRPKQTQAGMAAGARLRSLSGVARGG